MCDGKGTDMAEEQKNAAARDWPVMEIMDYGPEACHISLWDFASPRPFAALADIPKGQVRWVNVDGPRSEALLHEIGGVFQIHPLVIHNILESEQRAKVEEYGHFLSIVTKVISFEHETLVVEHTNILLGANFVLTFGNMRGDVFTHIRTRLQADARVRTQGADHLAYLLLDAIVDGYFDVLEAIGDQIDALEDDIMAETAKEHLLRIRTVKKNLLLVNRHIWPLRDVASLLGKESGTLIRPETEPYVRDVYNHIVQAIDSTETCRDLLSGLADLHFSNISYRMNEIMKVLTIISTIFIPLTFIAGIYGMNFKNMPELSLPWGYAAVWVVMLIISALMVLFFKRKKWF